VGYLGCTTDVSALLLVCLLFSSAMHITGGPGRRPRRNLGHQPSPKLALGLYIGGLLLYVAKSTWLNRPEKDLLEHLLTIFTLTAMACAVAFVRRYAFHPGDCISNSR